MEPIIGQAVRVTGNTSCHQWTVGETVYCATAVRASGMYSFAYRSDLARNPFGYMYPEDFVLLDSNLKEEPFVMPEEWNSEQF